MNKQTEMRIITDYGLPSKRWARRRLIEHRGKVLKRLYIGTRQKEKALGKLGISSNSGKTFLWWNAYEGDMQTAFNLATEVSAAWDCINHRWATYVKYVNGGGTWYGVPEMKKERRKELRKCRSLPLQYYQQMGEDEDWTVSPDAQVSFKVPNYMTNLHFS
jgi:hypothetical protein